MGGLCLHRGCARVVNRSVSRYQIKAAAAQNWRDGGSLLGGKPLNTINRGLAVSSYKDKAPVEIRAHISRDFSSEGNRDLGLKTVLNSAIIGEAHFSIGNSGRY